MKIWLSVDPFAEIMQEKKEGKRFNNKAYRQLSLIAFYRGSGIVIVMSRSSLSGN